MAKEVLTFTEDQLDEAIEVGHCNALQKQLIELIDEFEGAISTPSLRLLKQASRLIDKELDVQWKRVYKSSAIVRRK